MTHDGKPTTSERYARALESHHLEVKESHGDVDYLIAAGWATDALGVMLHRLRAEYDAVRTGHINADKTLRDAYRARRDAAGTEEELAAAGTMLAAAEAAALTSRALILVQLKTLQPAKEALSRYAIGQATRMRFMRDNQLVCQIAARALDLWIDALCGPCQGTGSVGVFGSPRIQCRACNGTRRRTLRLAQEPGDHNFGVSLMVKMDSKVDHVARQIRRFLARQG